jgi:hypothetical protein
MLTDVNPVDINVTSLIIRARSVEPVTGLLNLEHGFLDTVTTYRRRIKNHVFMVASPLFSSMVCFVNEVQGNRGITGKTAQAQGPA